MSRPRYQRGSLEETGKIVTKWKAHWYVWITDDEGNEDRRHRSRIIGRKPGHKGPMSAADAALPELTKAQAQAELDRIIQHDLGHVNAPRRDGSVTFGQFWRERWLPLRESTWRANTRLTVLNVFEKHIGPRWDEVRLDHIDAPQAAAWLGELADRHSVSLVWKARTYLMAVMSEAVDQDYLPKNPLRRMRRPRVRRAIDRTALTAEDVRLLRAEIDGERDKLILDLLLTTGMRPCELFALRWADVLQGGLYVDEGWTRGRIEEPKTPSSMAAVAVPDEIMERVAQWCRISNPASQQAFMFPSQEGTPIYPENWRKRVLYPAAERAGVRVNYQIIRRTLATLSVHSGVPIKAVQAQLRHSSAQTTLDVYTQVVTAAQSEAAESVFQLMKRGGKPLQGRAK
jgi:integrase